MILSAIAATAIVFSLSRAVGDPRCLLFATSGYGISDEAVAEIRKELALDRAYPVQYLLWLGRVLRGDLGETLAFKLPVARTITEKIPHSLQLGDVCLVILGRDWCGIGGSVGGQTGYIGRLRREVLGADRSIDTDILVCDYFDSDIRHMAGLVTSRLGWRFYSRAVIVAVGVFGFACDGDDAGWTCGISETDSFSDA